MRIIRATEEHLRIAAENLCASDLQEFHCMKSGRNPVDVLVPEAVEPNTCAIMLGSMVLAVGGHSEMSLWFVTTNVVQGLSKAQRFQFYRTLKDHLGWVKHRSPSPKTNWVMAENHAHIRLLTKLGAKFNRGIFMSPGGFAFKQFWL